ncbi:transglutaminase domain-containing protein [Polaribacter atrinae]|uniref:transglutaminase domain-containing protein n=1 Tax=Polaribacter atrinae TaxID=1333662 RepID=UPI0030F676EA
MKRITIVLLLLSQISLVAQDYKFGKVSKEELKEEFYPSDASADAAYLYKRRRTYFTYVQDKGFQVITEIHERIKIYNKSGFDKATKSITYYKPEKGDNEKVTSIKGYSFALESGKVKKEKLSKSSIFDEKLSRYRSIKKITFPNVKVGSVLDLEYKIISPYRSIDDVDYQFDIPVKLLNYKIEIPEYYSFTKKTKGYYFIDIKEGIENGSITMSQRVRTSEKSMGETLTSQVVTSKVNLKTNIDIYESENIPALKNNEPYVTDVKNYRGGVKYELASTKFPNSILKFYSNNWEDVSEQIYKSESFGAELEKTSYYKDDLEEILKTTKTELEKIDAIFQFVKNQVKWNNYNGIYTVNGVRKAFKERVGNIADINLMLTSMLRSAGLDANPVLLSTRVNGVPFFPTIEGFNYVIATVALQNGKTVLLDASEEFSVPNILPTRALNWKGRKVAKDGTSSWIQLTSSKHALEDHNVMVKISEDMLVKGLIRTNYDNLNALNYRKNNNHIKEEELKESLEEKYGFEIDGYRVVNKEDLDKPIIRTLQFSSDNLVENVNGKLYVEPLLFLSEHQNPFKLEDRKFPVDFATPWKESNTVSIQVPEGYKVETLPEPLAIGLPDSLGVFKFQVTQQGNKIRTLSVLQFNNALIAPQYYAALKGFYSQLVEKQSEKIVLIKI